VIIALDAIIAYFAMRSPRLTSYVACITRAILVQLRMQEYHPSCLIELRRLPLFDRSLMEQLLLKALLSLSLKYQMRILLRASSRVYLVHLA
jgi:hypothetical protein